jgi:hypothetical protein
MFHEHNPFLTSLVRKSKSVILGERGSQDKSPSYNIYIVNSKCFDVTLSKGKEGKSSMSRKRESTYANAKFGYNYGKISRV